MRYEGKIYGKVGGKHFDTGKTSEDWDKLETIKDAVIDMFNELDQHRVEIPHELHPLFDELEKLVKLT